MTEQYKVVFDFAGYGALYDSIDLIKDGLESVFVESYNQYCNAVNPNYEIWNAEAKSLGIMGSDDPESDYMRYIWRKRSEILNHEMTKSTFVEIKKWEPQGASYEFYIDENCQFHMSLVGDMLGLGYVDISIHLSKN